MKKQAILVFIIMLVLSVSAFSAGRDGGKGRGHGSHGNGNGYGHITHGNGNGYGHNCGHNGGGGTPEPASILLILGGIGAALGVKKIKDL